MRTIRYLSIILLTPTILAATPEYTLYYTSEAREIRSPTGQTIPLTIPGTTRNDARTIKIEVPDSSNPVIRIKKADLPQESVFNVITPQQIVVLDGPGVIKIPSLHIDAQAVIMQTRNIQLGTLNIPADHQNPITLLSTFTFTVGTNTPNTHEYPIGNYFIVPTTTPPMSTILMTYEELQATAVSRFVSTVTGNEVPQGTARESLESFIQGQLTNTFSMAVRIGSPTIQRLLEITNTTNPEGLIAHIAQTQEALGTARQHSETAENQLHTHLERFSGHVTLTPIDITQDLTAQVLTQYENGANIEKLKWSIQPAQVREIFSPRMQEIWDRLANQQDHRARRYQALAELAKRVSDTLPPTQPTPPTSNLNDFLEMKSLMTGLFDQLTSLLSLLTSVLSKLT